MLPPRSASDIYVQGGVINVPGVSFIDTDAGDPSTTTQKLQLESLPITINSHRAGAFCDLQLQLVSLSGVLMNGD